MQYQSKKHDLGGFSVRRAIPNKPLENVGPFVFFDHFGPVDFPPGEGINVRPHPHIGIATVTYLFEGQILHQDSLGTITSIHPGEVNLMATGRGMVHSERTEKQIREQHSKLHGIQLWLALPLDLEEMKPEFKHYKAEDIPSTNLENLEVNTIMGDSCQMLSPVKLYSPMFYVSIHARAVTEYTLSSKHNQEQAVYIASGKIKHKGKTYTQGEMLYFDDCEDIPIILSADTIVLYFGGDALPEPRHKYWNFVSSDKQRIQKAKDDWSNGNFSLIPTDNEEYIPLPD